jgi:excisionase family DNA binding protein
MTTKLLHSVPEAAELLGVKKSKLYGLLATGELGSVRVGSRRLIPATELQRFVESLGGAK